MKIFRPKLSTRALIDAMHEESRRMETARLQNGGALNEGSLLLDFKMQPSGVESDVQVWEKKITGLQQRKMKLAARLFSHIFRKQYAINRALVAGTALALKSLRNFSEQLQTFYREFRAQARLGAILAARLDKMQNRLAQLDKKLSADIEASLGRAELLEQETREERASLEAEMEGMRTLLQELEQKVETIRRAGSPSMDEKKKREMEDFYLAFENVFRGTREDIKERARFYLPHLQKATAGDPGGLVLDIGCGRGEWLELLKENQFVAKGVDTNWRMVSLCKELSLDVTAIDAVQYLSALPDAGLCAVSGFHIIEHLPFGTLMDIFKETFRVLKPGGVAIFETPNPANVLVGSNTFYLDPTHRNPLPAPLTGFVAQHCGFAHVETVERHPNVWAHTMKPEDSGEVKQFNAYFNGPMDYAVICWKPNA